MGQKALALPIPWGVMSIARQAFDQLQRRYPVLTPHRATVLCAALLHDIGHGPFSHTAEEIFLVCIMSIGPGA